MRFISFLPGCDEFLAFVIAPVAGSKSMRASSRQGSLGSFSRSWMRYASRMRVGCPFCCGWYGSVGTSRNWMMMWTVPLSRVWML